MAPTRKPIAARTPPAPIAAEPAPAPPPKAADNVAVMLRLTKRQRRRLHDAAADNEESGDGPASVQKLLEAAVDSYFAGRGLPPVFGAD